MSFPHGPRRGPAPVRVRGAVWGVGRRVSVTSADGLVARVALTDEGGDAVVGNLVDGTEVEILGWRPSGSRGVRYQVRATRDGVEGWVAAGSLRDPTAVVPPAVVVAERLRAPTSSSTGRRFGER